MPRHSGRTGPNLTVLFVAVFALIAMGVGCMAIIASIVVPILYVLGVIR